MGSMLRNLWGVFIFIVLFAANMIIGHNFIPSFVQSEHIPRYWDRTRPAFYSLAILSLVLAVFFLIRVIIFSRVLRDIWPNYWI